MRPAVATWSRWSPSASKPASAWSRCGRRICPPPRSWRSAGRSGGARRGRGGWRGDLGVCPGRLAGPRHGALPGGAGVGVLIVGGGTIGCAPAEALARASAEVILYERGAPGGEASGAAAGLLTAFGGGPRTQFQDLAIASWRLYPTVAADLRERTGIDVELVRRGTLYPFLDAGEISEMTVPEPLATEFGAQLLDEEQVRRQEPALSPTVRGALFVAGDHWVNSQRLVTAYAQAAALAGVEMRTGRSVGRILVADGRARGVVAEGEEVTGDAVPIAAAAPPGRLLPSLCPALPLGP